MTHETNLPVSRTVSVSIAVDNETHQASVALRDLGDANHGHLLTTTEARHIAAMLIHAAKVVDGTNAQAAEMVRDGMSGREIRMRLSALYPNLLNGYRRPDR